MADPEDAPPVLPAVECADTTLHRSRLLLLDHDAEDLARELRLVAGEHEVLAHDAGDDVAPQHVGGHRVIRRPAVEDFVSTQGDDATVQTRVDTYYNHDGSSSSS